MEEGGGDKDNNQNTTSDTMKGQLQPPQSRGCCKGCRNCLSDVAEECGKLKEHIMQINCQRALKEACSVDNVKKKLPIIKWLPKYRPSHIQGDVIAGLTVGLTVIPQGLAYAVVAELPPQYGLYSAFMGCFVYCLFGTSKDITLGPTAIMSLMTAIFASYKIPSEYKDLTEYDKKEIAAAFNPIIAVAMTFFCGLVQFAMGLFNIGFLVDFIPHPVINSFTTAAAITIACGQVKKWLGLHNIPREFIHQMIETCKHIPQTNIWDCLLGVVCMVILFGFKKAKQIKYESDDVSISVLVLRKILWLFATARNAIVIGMATGLAYALYSHNIKKFTLTGHIKSGLPPAQFPMFSANLYNVSSHEYNLTLTSKDIFSNIGSGFAIVPLIGLVETIAIGKAFARRNNYRIDANQELIAIGLSNTIGSMVSSYPVTGSFSRTAVNSQSGVKTPAGGVVTGALVILALAFLTRLFYYIPNAALAAVIIMAVIDMADFSMVKKLWRVKKIDLIPWFATFIFSFILGIEYGILIGIGISLLFLLYPWARPKVTINKSGSTLFDPDTSLGREVLIVEVDQGLRFPGVDYLRQKVVDKASDSGERSVCHPVVLDLQHVASVDYSTVHGMEEILEEFGVMGSSIVMSNVKPDVLAVLEAEEVPGLEIYGSNEDAIRALQRGTQLGEVVVDEHTPLGHTDTNNHPVNM